MDYRIEQVKTDHDSLLEVRDLLKLVFEKRADKFSYSYLKWLYSDNPAGRVVGFNAYYKDLLVAHYATMPIYMIIAGRKTLGLLSLNTATHPDHRGRGLFIKLAEQTYDFASLNGYRYVIGVANANSIHGFIQYLGFKLVGPLSFKIGLGDNLYCGVSHLYSRYWDKDLLAWRLNNPSMSYYKNGEMVVSPIIGGFKKMVFHDSNNLLSLRKLYGRPFNLYIGFGADLSKGIYCDVPKIIKRSPFNLIFRDMTDGELPEMSKSNTLFELIDFDVA